MSVHQLRPRTPAETALIERAEGAGSYAIGGSRAGAIEALRRDGLPTRRVEAWHYTDLRALMGRLPEISAASAEDGAMLSPLIAGSHVVDISTPETFHQLDGVKVSKLDETADFSTSSNHLDRAIDTVRLMNSAFGAPAVAIDVAAHRRLCVRSDYPGRPVRTPRTAGHRYGNRPFGPLGQYRSGASHLS